MTGFGGAADRVGPVGDWGVGRTTGLAAAWLEPSEAGCDACAGVAEAPAECEWCCVPALLLVEGFTTTIFATAGGPEPEPALTPTPTAGACTPPASRIQGSATPASASA